MYLFRADIYENDLDFFNKILYFCIRKHLFFQPTNNKLHKLDENKLHELNGLEESEFGIRKNGFIFYEKYLSEGSLNNKDYPAYKQWHSNGMLFLESYVIHGEYHRIGGPAISEWYSSGKLRKSTFYENGSFVKIEMTDLKDLDK